MHSHDPFHPTASYLPPVNGPQSQSAEAFREHRWRQAGATDEQIDQLRDEHNSELSLDDQLALNDWIDRHSDPELAEKLATLPDQADDGDPGGDGDPDLGSDGGNPSDDGQPDPGTAEAEYSGNVTDILVKIGSSADKAREALDVENARDKPRVSLINELNKIIGA